MGLRDISTVQRAFSDIGQHASLKMSTWLVGTEPRKASGLEGEIRELGHCGHVGSGASPSGVSKEPSSALMNTLGPLGTGRRTHQLRRRKRTQWVLEFVKRKWPQIGCPVLLPPRASLSCSARRGSSTCLEDLFKEHIELESSSEVTLPARGRPEPSLGSPGAPLPQAVAVGGKLELHRFKIRPGGLRPRCVLCGCPCWVGSTQRLTGLPLGQCPSPTP